MKFRFILLGCVFVFSFCKKKDTVEELSVSEDVKAYGCFQPGTYWIYRDSATGTIDSLYVTQTARSISHNRVEENKYHNVEILKLNARSGQSQSSGVMMTLAADRGKTIFNHGTDNVVIYMFDVDPNHVYEFGGGINKHVVLANCTLQNNNYSDVHVVSYYQKINSRMGTYWVVGKNYWKKNIGIIKKYGFGPNFVASSCSELIRYHIVQ